MCDSDSLHIFTVRFKLNILINNLRKLLGSISFGSELPAGGLSPLRVQSGSEMFGIPYAPSKQIKAECLDVRPPGSASQGGNRVENIVKQK